MVTLSREPVLLIESDADARTILTNLIKTRHDVTAVSTGAAALESLAGGAVPCLIMYVLRAGDDSGAFRIAQQADAGWAGIPTILFSAHSAPMSAGFVDMLFTLVGRHCERTVH